MKIYNIFKAVLLVCGAASFFMITTLFQIKYVVGNDYLVILVNTLIYLFWFVFGCFYSESRKKEE
jgi:hypothetical protein